VISCEVQKEGTKERIALFSEELKAGSQVSIEKLVALRDLEPGAYTLRVTAAEGEQRFEREARFEIVAPH
jgi:hypothetical protein